MKMKKSHSALFLALLLPLPALAAVGFGSRHAPEAIEPATPESAPVADVPVAAPRQNHVPTPPPSTGDTEWLRVPFEKAENEVLALFSRDVPKLAELTDKIAIFEVRVSGRLPREFSARFRAKLERVLLAEKHLTVKECPGCDQARLVKDASGQLRYEPHSTELGRKAKVASDLGLEHLLVAELDYSPEDLELRVRMVDPSTDRIEWTHDYSTADVTKESEALVETEAGGLAPGDSLARVLIGEIAFTTVLSFGTAFVPSIEAGSGTSMSLYPAVDFLIGERYDRGRKRFGFVIGGAFNMGTKPELGNPVPFILRVGPQYRYTLNPYNVSTARYSLAGELGGLFSTGLSTGYVAFGPEVTMINKFSASLTPMYILKANVGGPQVYRQNDAGGVDSAPGANIGSFGGLAVMAKVNINW